MTSLYLLLLQTWYRALSLPWLGAAHLTAIVLLGSRLVQLLRGRTNLFRLLGRARAIQAAAITLASVCLGVSVAQLNARLAADSLPLISGHAAPFEWASEHLSKSCKSYIPSMLLHVVFDCGNCSFFLKRPIRLFWIRERPEVSGCLITWAGCRLHADICVMGLVHCGVCGGDEALHPPRGLACALSPGPHPRSRTLQAEVVAISHDVSSRGIQMSLSDGAAVGEI